MTILVTGGAGFIGSHLTERLLDDRFDVRVVDNLTSNPIPIEQWQAQLGPMWNRMEFYRESIEYHSRRGQLGMNVTGIYHLASPVGPAGILQHSGEMVHQIVRDTYAVIKLALMHRCRLVFVSTSEVYGGGINGLCAEDMPCIIQPKVTVRLEYAVAKLAAEIAVINTCKVTDLDAVIIRPFNVAGPRQSGKGGFVLPRFVSQALNDESLSVFGDGLQIRAFTHVEDIVDGLLRAMGRGKTGSVYNLGNPANRTTILDLAERVWLAVDPARRKIHLTDGKLIYGPLYEEANDKYPDSTKAMSELYWQPVCSIEQTIQDVIDYERDKAHV